MWKYQSSFLEPFFTTEIKILLQFVQNIFLKLLYKWKNVTERWYNIGFLKFINKLLKRFRFFALGLELCCSKLSIEFVCCQKQWFIFDKFVFVCKAMRILVRWSGKKSLFINASMSMKPDYLKIILNGFIIVVICVFYSKIMWITWL